MSGMELSGLVGVVLQLENSCGARHLLDLGTANVAEMCLPEP